MSCFVSLNVDIFGTRQNIKKRSTAFIHVFHALSYEKIKIFISYPLYATIDHTGMLLLQTRKISALRQIAFLPGDFRSWESPQTLPALFIGPFEHVELFRNLKFPVKRIRNIQSTVLSSSEGTTAIHLAFNPIQAKGVFRDPQRLLSITLRAFEIIL